MVLAQIKPELIRWARERARLSPAAAAKQVRQEPETVLAWERGEKRPTFRQAQHLARGLHVPFGYLFLPVPPVEEIAIPDLRTVTRDGPGELSLEFVDSLNDALRKQRWYREHLEEEGQGPLGFVGRFTAGDEWDVVGADIRDTLQINDAARREANSWEAFLTGLIRRSEAAGVLVLRNGVVGNNTRRPLDVGEFRGFALSDSVAPLVFINARDARAAQIFTLAHELAHLWIGESGVSNPDFRLRSADQGSVIESLCNRVAAETLVPSLDFRTRWQPVDPVPSNLQRLAAHYRVSTLVILRQALDLGLLVHERYQDHLREEVAKWRRRAAEGGSFYPTLLARSSTAFTLALVSAVNAERVPRREAAGLLNVKPETLKGVAQHLSGEGAPGG